MAHTFKKITRHLLFSIAVLCTVAVQAQLPLTLGNLFPDAEKRALTLHRKGMEMADKGKHKKANKYFGRAANFSRERSRELEMFDYYLAQSTTKFEQGKKKEAKRLKQEAMKYLENAKCADECDGIDRVREAASYSLIYANMGERYRAVEKCGQALRLYKLYGVDDAQLYSTLLNNYGVLYLFYESKNQPQDSSKAKYNYTHQRDVIRADSFIQKSMNINPENCMAHKNFTAIQALKNIPIKDGKIYRSEESFDDVIVDSSYMSCEQGDTLNMYYALEEEFEEASELLLIMDYSGSMIGERYDLMIKTTLHLIDTLPEAIKIGVLSVEGDCETAPRLVIEPGSISRKDLKAQIQAISPYGSTPLNTRLEKAAKMFPKGGKHRMALLMTDGVDVCTGPEYTCGTASTLKNANIQLFVLTQLLEDDASYLNYGVYNCLAQNTHGSLIHLQANVQVEKKSKDLVTALYNLPLNLKDLGKGIMQPFSPKAIVPKNTSSLDGLTGF